MMWWPAGSMTGWGWAAMTISMVLFWVVLILGAALLYCALSRPAGDGRAESARPTPEQLLAERFARGEIDEDEYRRSLRALSSTNWVANRP